LLAEVIGADLSAFNGERIKGAGRLPEGILEVESLAGNRFFG